MGLLDRLRRRVAVPEGTTGALQPDEEVLAVAELAVGHVAATRRGLWVPGDDGPVLVAWHLVSKAVWDGAELELTVAEETGTAGRAVLLADVLVRRYGLVVPDRVPQVVNERVLSGIRSSHHRELPGGGAWFVQRSVPGRDGVVLQVRVDPGTDAEVVAEVAAEVAARLPAPRRT